MTGLVLNPYSQFRDDPGLPVSNGTVTFYVNKTTTLDTIFTDSTGTIPQANPYTLDASGRITGDVWYSGFKTLQLKDESGAEIRTIDDVTTLEDLEAFFAAVDFGVVPQFNSFDAPALRESDLTGIDRVQTASFYPGWESTLEGPRGGGIYYRDGSSGPPATVYTNNEGFYEANGAGFRRSPGEPIAASQFGVVFDGVTDSIVNLTKANAYASSLGGADILLEPGTVAISSVFTLSAGNGLIGGQRSTSVIKQTSATENGIKLSGGIRLTNVQVEAPIGGVSETTRGLDASNTSDIIVYNCRVLYFGYCVYSEDLTWRQTYSKVRVDLPRTAGFYFDNATQHLEIYLSECYVQNLATVGATNKTAYHIEGSLGTYMNNCTSDGGLIVGTKNLGANIISATVKMSVTHWEGYQSPAGFVGGAEYDSIIRASGSDISIDTIRFQSCTPDVAADATLIYVENSSQATLTNIDPDSSTLAAFTDQHIGVSDDFGDNLIEILGSNRALVLGAQRGTGAGTAQYTRTGVIDTRTSDTVSFTVDVNLVKTIVFAGSSGDLTALTGAYSDGQCVDIVHRSVGVVVINSGALRLQGGVDFTATLNSTQRFIYSEAGSFWYEIGRGS